MNPQRIVQQDFSAGMFRSVSPELIPANGAWDIVNGLLTEDGAIFRRGGTAYRSTSAVGGAPTVLWDGVLATGGQQTVVARNGGLYRMDAAGAVTSLGGSGVAAPGRAVAYQGVLYLPGGVTYDGATVGVAAKVGQFYAVVANRLLVASGDRIDFSGIGTPLAFAGTDFHQIPGGVRILGIHGLRDSAVVFTTNGVWIISNMAYELTDANGNVQHRLDHYSSEILLWGDAGVAAWEGGLVVPGADGVWHLNLGIASEAPQAFVPVGKPIQSLHQDYVRSGFMPGGAVVHRHHYLLPILSVSDVIDVLVCRLDAAGRPWTHLSGFGSKATMFARRVVPATNAPELLAGHTGGRVLAASYFSPDTSNQLDANSSEFSWSMTTRDYATGGIVKNTVMKLRASYQLENPGGTNPTIEAFYIQSRVGASGTKWGRFLWGSGTWSAAGADDAEGLDGSAPADPEGTAPFSWKVRRRARFVTFRLRSSSTTSWLSLRALELFVRTSRRL